MRRIALLSLLLVAMLCLTAGEAAVAAKSMRLPVDPAAVGLSDHPLVGTWTLTTSAGAVPTTFGADGSVVMEFPATAFGNDGFAFVSYAVGTWEPMDGRGATFTVVQPIFHANGVSLGSVTLDGSLALRDDPALTEMFVSFDRITIRDGRNNRIALASGGAEPTASLLDQDALLGNGGRDCAWCAAAVAEDALVASGAAADVGPAEVRYIAAEDAAAQPVAPRVRGGCNTCR